MRLFTLRFVFLSFPQEIEDRDSLNSYCAMCSLDLKSYFRGTSLVIQWSRLCDSYAGTVGLIPRRDPRSHRLPVQKTNKLKINKINKINTLPSMVHLI